MGSCKGIIECSPDWPVRVLASWLTTLVRPTRPRSLYWSVRTAKIVRKRQSRLKVLDAEYDERARIQSVIWECEQGIWLSCASWLVIAAAPISK